MSIINESIFQYYCTLSQQVQKIQTQVKKEDITPELRFALHKQLEGLQESLETFRARAFQTQKQVSPQFTQLEEVERQIVSLYRIIEERFEEYEIHLISQEAMELSQSLESGKLGKLAKQVNELRHNIHFLFQHRRPSMKHRAIINLALKLSDQADNVLASKGKGSQEQLQLIQLLKTLLNEAVSRAEKFEDTNPGELAMELYEIAELFQNDRFHEGRLKLNLIRFRLTLAQQGRLDEAMHSSKEVAKILFEIIDGDPCLEWNQKMMRSSISYLQA